MTCSYQSSIELGYFNWLIEKIKPYDNHLCVLKYLFEKDFLYFVANDDNRATDGIELREKYSDETGIPHPKEGECSVLEALISLALRCENEILWGYFDSNDHTSEYFWMMLDNLGLCAFEDADYDEDCTDEIVDRFLYRRYCKNGYGGLFPLNNPPGDQRKTELWYQMCYYLDEKYG